MQVVAQHVGVGEIAVADHVGIHGLQADDLVLLERADGVHVTAAHPVPEAAIADLAAHAHRVGTLRARAACVDTAARL